MDNLIEATFVHHFEDLMQEATDSQRAAIYTALRASGAEGDDFGDFDGLDQFLNSNGMQGLEFVAVWDLGAIAEAYGLSYLGLAAALKESVNNDGTMECAITSTADTSTPDEGGPDSGDVRLRPVTWDKFDLPPARPRFDPFGAIGY